jgi:serine O-acetyltransferase
MAGSMIFQDLRDDIRSVLARDPAARTSVEVVLCYPGFQAIATYRVSHWLWQRDWKLLARFLSNVARTITGIEIHPAARIGKRLFIDHGMGVVIGATAEIGDDCTLYQGVTLGGTALHQGKRHPTLGDGVIVGSGAQVLGAFTVGDGARIGANAVAVSEVPAHTTVVGIPAKPVTRPPVLVETAVTTEAFLPYGTPCGDNASDPVARSLAGMMEEVSALRARMTDLERQLADSRAEPAVAEAPDNVTRFPKTGPAKSVSPKTGGPKSGAPGQGGSGRGG